MGELGNNEKAPKKKSFVKTLKAEFKKIIWPDKKTTGKQTVAVISISVCVGLLIGLLDMVIKYLIGFII